MPQLPSGRHVSFAAESLAAFLEANEQHPRDLRAISTTDDLWPYVDIELFREGTAEEQAACLEERALAAGSSALPPGLVAYASGITLAELDSLMADWGAADVEALRDFVHGDRFEEFLEELLQEVREFEREPPPVA